ncbi:poly(3-hydroxyalkanoate) depolymerase [Bacillus nakamurai]|uniref:Poly(3-hydroxyalkanoate) depolymerase n=1 Tax=Bacillus nakamurai TaxID=1793963 RepID=A0A150FAL4_9BACI|nr:MULTISPECIES: acyl carrier protein [Bacillus]KXZ15036.1 poly(3-hydroxyalkanoate) depolymerase [Bacillus nakamurai]KXZ22256.1 poly(3-hydroxyalkanoate) depolymerase [Bacillus nakamurai]MBY8914476.1 acyl carrier protein [Bacillus sp. YC2]MCP6681317.1 acyl carrier protein [Bacillus nakamurai]MED1228528.1 acyl carrier protein [Bacillus nakamurai]
MNKERIFEMLQRNIYEVLPELEGRELSFEDRLADLGADSVDRAEIITMMLEDLSLQIPRVELTGVTNIGELAEKLYEKVQAV